METMSIIISAIALIVAGWTLWATQLKRGTVKMTRPTVFFFGPDSSKFDDKAKVFLRSLLYSTSRRGRVIESMFVRLRVAETAQSFPVWVYGNSDLARGSGIFVGPEGVATNHHFLLPMSSSDFVFEEGNYKIEIVAKLVGDNSDTVLGEYELTVSTEQANALQSKDAGLYFDWGGDHKKYVGALDFKPTESELPLPIGNVLNEYAKKKHDEE